MSYPPVQDQINAIMVRLALLDGQGLASPATGFTATTSASLAGLRTDIQQAVLSLEANLNELYTDVSAINSQVDQMLGVTSTPYTAVVITPPTT